MSSYIPGIKCKVPDTWDNCPDFLENYLSYQHTFLGLSPYTVLDACVTLREFCQYIHFVRQTHSPPRGGDDHKDIDVSLMPLGELAAVTQEDAERYLKFLDTSAGNAASTLIKKRTILKNFYAYLERNSQELSIVLQDRNPFGNIFVPKTRGTSTEKPLSPAQMQTLCNCVSGEKASRDRVILLLLITCVLNLSELSGLNIGDVQEEFLAIRQSGKVVSYRYLTPNCRQALSSYMADLRAAGEDMRAGSPLFPGAGFSRRMTDRGIIGRIEAAVKQAGLQSLGISAKSLKNTGLYYLKNAKGIEPSLVRLHVQSGYRQTFSVSPEIYKSTEEILSVMEATPLIDLY